jgi:hypothetical protein
MKRSIICLGSAIVALAAGCRESRPPETPVVEPASPTFESNVPPQQAPRAQETPAAPEMGATPNAPPEQPAAQKPPAPAETPLAQAAPMENERTLCDALAGHARLRAEDVPHGVAIVITPRSGKEAAMVRDDTRRADTMIRLHRTESGPIGEACGLFSITRLPGVTTKVAQLGNGSRIVMTTVRAADLKDLRRIAREQVGALTPKKK